MKKINLNSYMLASGCEPVIFFVMLRICQASTLRYCSSVQATDITFNFCLSVVQKTKKEVESLKKEREAKR